MLVGRGPQLLLPESYANVIVADGPVHYARYDDTTGLTTVATVGDNVTHTGSFTITLDQKSLLISEPAQASYLGVSNAARVDYSAISGGGVAIGSGAGGWSVEVWLEFDSTTGTYQTILVDASQPILYLRNGNLIYWLGSGIIATPILLIDTTYHVVFAYDGNTSLKVYVDGTLEDTLTVTTSSRDPTWAYAFHNGTNEGLFGYMQEMAIYDYELTLSQVTSHYNAGT